MTSSDEAALFNEVLAAPESDAPRRALAAMLEKRGDPRGELIRVQLRIADLHRVRGSVAELASLTPREEELLDAHGEEWERGLPGAWGDYTFRRGFVEGVRIEATAFPADAARLYKKAPILHLQLVANSAKELLPVAQSPSLGRIVSIDLFDQKIGDDGVVALAQSPYVQRLAWLELGYTGAGRRALEALCGSPGLPRLAWLGFAANDAPSPCDRVGGVDGDAILDWESSPLGEELEQRYGPKRWMHRQCDDTTYHPPRPFAFVGGA